MKSMSELSRLLDRSVLVSVMARRSLSVRGLASRVGVSKSLIDNLRRGEQRSCETAIAERISEELGVDPELLFGPYREVVASVS